MYSQVIMLRSLDLTPYIALPLNSNKQHCNDYAYYIYPFEEIDEQGCMLSAHSINCNT